MQTLGFMDKTVQDIQKYDCVFREMEHEKNVFQKKSLL